MYTYIHFISFNLVTFFLACFFNFSNLFSIFIFIFSPSPAAAAVCRFPSGLELIGSERGRQGGAVDRGGNCCISTKAAVAKIIQAKRTTRPAEAKPSPASPRSQPPPLLQFPFLQCKVSLTLVCTKHNKNNSWGSNNNNNYNENNNNSSSNNKTVTGSKELRLHWQKKQGMF